LSAPILGHVDPYRGGSVDGQLRLSEIIASLSYALDITEGQPEGHAVRSCIIGLRIADELQLSDDRKTGLFYALLLKDLGCSSNAARMCSLFQADERDVKRDIKLIDWTSLLSVASFSLHHVMPGTSIITRLIKVAGMTRTIESTSRSLMKVRCERGADIARMLGFPENTAQAILDLDEHFDGHGHPRGLRGNQISLEGQICSLAQTMEVFITAGGVDAARNIARERSGTWFNPEVVKVFLDAAKYSSFKKVLSDPNPRQALQEMEPADHVRSVDNEMLDRIALAFSQVIDAKSPWTMRHSQGVADIAGGIGRAMGMSAEKQRELRRAGLLHDIGKLGVPNTILDKPAKLTDSEFAQMKQHTDHTHQILERVSSFQGFADYASAHHERLDGKGYHRGLHGDAIPVEARILAVADVCEAMSADRPYRSGMSAEQIIDILRSESGTAFCPDVVTAFLQVQDESNLIENLKARSV
tara:strand:+ start:178413 stop:179828 length:1416 start_codon:yes stop_codon:yes gene_type:complete